MSSITDKTNRLFLEAKLSDEDLGYPDDVAFLAADEAWSEDILWRNLTEGIATVLVDEETELLLTPLHRNLLDRLRKRVPVSVSQRAHGHASPYATRSRLGRHPVREMRQLAHA